MNKRVVGVFGLAAAILATAAWCGAEEAPKNRLPLGVADSVATLRVKSLSGALDNIAEVVELFDARAAKEVKDGLSQELFGGEEMPGVVKTGPAAIIFLDPRISDEPIGIFTLDDPEKFTQSIRNLKSKVVGKLGLFGDAEEALTAVAQELQAAGIKAIPVDDMKHTMVATIDVPALLRRYKPDIRAALDEARNELAAPAGEDAPPGPPEAVRQMALRTLGYAAKFIDQAEKQGGLVELGVNLNRTAITGRLTVEAAPGSQFAAFLAKNKTPFRPGLANFLPKESFLSSSSTNDPASVSELMLGLAGIAADIFGLDAQEAGAITKALEDWMANLSGLQASAALNMPEGACNLSVIGIKDSAAARASVKALVALTAGGKLGDFLKKYGVSVAYKEKNREYNGIPIDRAEIKIDWDKLFAELGVPAPNAREKADMLRTLKLVWGSENPSMDIVYGSHLLVVANGAGQEKAVEKEIDLMKSGGADGLGTTAEYKAALARHPKDATTLWTVSLFGYADTIANVMKQAMAGMPLPGGANIFPTRAELPPNEPLISGSVQSLDDALAADVYVPIKPVKDFVDVIKRKIGQMMQQMMDPDGGMPPAEMDEPDDE